MSKYTEEIFRIGVEQALKEANTQAFKLKSLTHQIPISHLFSNCGRATKDKLIGNLIVASELSFETFMSFIFSEDRGKSSDSIERIKALAKHRHEHPSIILFEQLSKRKDPRFTFKDLIECLENAQLYRAIADLDIRSIQDCHSKVKETIDNSLNSFPILSRNTHSKLPVEQVLVTFMNDGRTYLNDIRKALAMSFGKTEKVFKVHTLEDFVQFVDQDPQKNILWILSQVDFVVPILTKKYFEMLKGEKVSLNKNINEKHAPFVARVLISEYESSFKNKKLRCFKPKNVEKPSNMLYCLPFQVLVEHLQDLPMILKKVS